MTTIATDGKTMAADGRGECYDLVVASALTKLVRLKDGSVLGLSGRVSVRPRLAAWIEGSGEFPKDSGDWTALHLTAGELRHYASRSGEAFDPIDVPAATGSGGELALGAMLHGASPLEAVAVAARRDPFTGGTITSLTLEDGP